MKAVFCLLMWVILYAWKFQKNTLSVNYLEDIFDGGTSKPNERWCRILLEKKGHFPPPPVTVFFLGTNFFFGFSEKFSKFFFNKIDCKKFSNFFCNEFSSKKFFNSLKMTIKNFLEIIFNEFGFKKFLIYFFNEIDCEKI